MDKQSIMFIIDNEQRKKLKSEGVDILLKRSIKELAMFYVDVFREEPTNLDLIGFAILLNEIYKNGEEVLDGESAGLGFVQIKRPEGVDSIYDTLDNNFNP